ncbi:MAG: hypothetical protein EON47_15365 [Acetobacteraceae bacterium]|nr:MAG: hypothetical protein EON47_15365 [Acetobacteraceae bacterium]
MDAAAVEALIGAGEATAGMVPKLRAARRAVRAGVGEVWIGSLGEPGVWRQGTRVWRQTPAQGLG